MLAEAQGNITGRVIDEQSQPTSFVNVVLLNRADSAFIMGTVTKEGHQDISDYEDERYWKYYLKFVRSMSLWLVSSARLMKELLEVKNQRL